MAIKYTRNSRDIEVGLSGWHATLMICVVFILGIAFGWSL